MLRKFIISCLGVLSLSFALVASAGSAQAASVGGLIAITNADRAANGLGALNYNGALTSAAYAKANDMLVHQYWAHTSPSGVGPWYWISAAGYPYVYAGENLANGSADDSTIIAAWMASPDHRANLLSPNFRDMGCGFASGVLLGVSTTITVCDFGSTAAELNPAPAPVYSAPAPRYSAPAYQAAANVGSAPTAQPEDTPAAEPAPAPKPVVPDYFKKSVLTSHPVPAVPAWRSQLGASLKRPTVAQAHHSFFMGSWLTAMAHRYHF